MSGRGDVISDDLEEGIQVEDESSSTAPPKGLTTDGLAQWERLGGLCDQHLGEVYSFFCLDCSRAACTVCCMKSHCKHKKKFVRTEGIDDGMFGHTGIFFPPEFTVDGLLRNVNKELQDVDLHSSEASDKIKACISRHKGVVEKKKKMLIEHVNAVKKAKLKYLQDQQKQLRKTLDELNGSMVYARRYLETDDHFSLLLAEKEITRRLAELNEKCSKVSLPTEQDWNLDKIKVIRDGRYVRVNHSRHAPSAPKPGMKTVHDSGFKATTAKLSFTMEADMFEAFVGTCCQELGEKYWLRVR